MGRLKEKHEIPNYDVKATILRENGWDTWYHDDNWIRTEWIEQGKKYDTMGCSTASAWSNLGNEPDELEYLHWWNKKNLEEQFYCTIECNHLIEGDCTRHPHTLKSHEIESIYNYFK